MDRVVIVGGGISGLATAFRIRQAVPDVALTMIEALDRPGGKMDTERVEGFTIEHGPNGFLDGKPEALQLAADLGLAVVHASDFAKKRFVCRGGRLRALPDSPAAFLKSQLLSWSGKWRLLREPWAAPMPPGVDETLSDFARRRIGPEARDYLIDPMVSGVFAGDPDRMSLAAAFPRIHELETRYGGLFRGMLGVMRERRKEGRKTGAGPAGPAGRLTSFSGGVRTLVDALRDRLADTLVLETPVTRVRRTAWGMLVYSRRPDGTERRDAADVVVLACPAYEASRILGDESPSLAATLADIPDAPIAVVATAFQRPDVPHPLDGFGFLIPKAEARPILGTLWDSAIFPDRAPAGQILLRSMVGGARDPEVVSAGDDVLVGRVRSQLRELLGIRADPVLVRVYRYEHGIPQYTVGHLGRLERIDRALGRFPGLFLCHNAYRGIALNDCCREAMRTARQALSFLSGRDPDEIRVVAGG
jgi:oxygen-dependent protoporphyrinogen oxidase